MSICSLRGFNVRFWRQAFIMAHTRTGLALMPGRTKLRLSLCFERSSHNSLYQMCEMSAASAYQNMPVQQMSKAAAGIPLYRAKQPAGCELNSSKDNDEQSIVSASMQSLRAPTPPCKPAARKMLHTDKSYKARNVIQPCKKLGGNKEPMTCDTGSVGKSRPPTKPCVPSGGQSGGESGKSRPSIGPCVPSKPSGDSGKCRTSIQPCRPSRGGAGGAGGAEGGGGGDGSGSGKGDGTCGGPPPPPCRPAIPPCRPLPSMQPAGCAQNTAYNQGSGGMDNKTKLLMALLAALGLGGLLWLLLRKKRGATKGDECVVGAGAGAMPAGGATIPASSSDLPKHVPYLLVGGGTAAFSAFRAIKSNDPRAKVLMITNEYRKPYMRPPLSKELWYSAQKGDVSKDYRFKQWTGSERSLYFEPDEFFVDPTKLIESVNGGIAVAQGFTVRKVDPDRHIVTLNDGYEISYDECLIATGCSPKSLPVFTQAPMSVKEKVMVYRSPEDFERLKRYADEKKCITIVGNGFTGSELACSLANYAKDKGIKIYQVFPETGNMSKVLPDYLSKWTMAKVEALGVCVLPQISIKAAQRDEDMLKLILSNGKSLLTDVVVVCVGCEPNTGIALTSGLEVDSHLGGFVVNSELEARRNLFVAGDASCFYDPLLGRRRVEHHDHSVVSGRLAGENMVGKKKSYTHQSMFWSDLGPEIGYEGIGLVDASLPTVGVFALPSPGDNRRTDNLTEQRSDKIEEGGIDSKKDLSTDVKCDPKDADEYGRGVIFYLKDDKIVGILLWNLFNRIGLARTIINQNKKYDDLNEVAKLFEIHA